MRFSMIVAIVGLMLVVNCVNAEEVTAAVAPTSAVPFIPDGQPLVVSPAPVVTAPAIPPGVPAIKPVPAVPQPAVPSRPTEKSVTVARVVEVLKVRRVCALRSGDIAGAEVLRQQIVSLGRQYHNTQVYLHSGYFTELEDVGFKTQGENDHRYVLRSDALRVASPASPVAVVPPIVQTQPVVTAGEGRGVMTPLEIILLTVVGFAAIAAIVIGWTMAARRANAGLFARRFAEGAAGFAAVGTGKINVKFVVSAGGYRGLGEMEAEGTRTPEVTLPTP